MAELPEAPELPDAVAGLSVWPVLGLPDIRPGADLAGLIAAAAGGLQDGDVLVVTSKVVSKAEGALVAVPPGVDRELVRQQAIEEQTASVVAVRGRTRIVRTRHGFVLASAGVDASNVDSGEIALLPTDSDASASALRAGIAARTGVRVGVIISDTFGRPWRNGLTDVAIGVAGLRPLVDLRGRTDAYGAALEMTETAVADDAAAAADLVKGKLGAIPVAVVRGLSAWVLDADGPGITPLIRDPAGDMFTLGTAEAMLTGARGAVAARRTVREFGPDPVPAAALRRAIAAAVTAPAPHHTTPWRFVVVREHRDRLLGAMAARWAADLRADGFDEAAITRRLARGEVLNRAPEIVVPCLLRTGAQAYPDPVRAGAEERMFVVAMGAAVQGLLVGLAAEGLGSAWVSSTLFCPDVVREALELPAEWEACGAVGIGWPLAPPTPRPERDPADFTLLR